MTLLSICFACFLVFNFSSAVLRFSGSKPFEGANLPYHKTKYGVKGITEDAFVRSPYAMVVADGLGGANFNSQYIAKAVTSNMFLEVLRNAPFGFGRNSGGAVHGSIAALLDDSLKQYNLKVKTLLNKYIQQQPQKIKRKITGYSSINAATTFIGAFLDRDGDKNVLEILQRGDSLAGVWRGNAYESNSGDTQIYSYEPIYKSSEHQLGFNAPLNFATGDQCMSKSLQSDSFTVYEFDLVVIGSDGFWDNVPYSAITFMINALVFARRRNIPVGDIIEFLGTYAQVFNPNLKRLQLGAPVMPDHLLPVNPNTEDTSAFKKSFLSISQTIPTLKTNLNYKETTDPSVIPWHMERVTRVVKDSAKETFEPGFDRTTFQVSVPYENYDPDYFRQGRLSTAEPDENGDIFYSFDDQDRRRVLLQEEKHFRRLMKKSPQKLTEPQTEDEELEEERNIQIDMSKFRNMPEANKAIKAFVGCQDSEMYGGDERAGLSKHLLLDCFLTRLAGGFNLQRIDFQDFFKRFDSKEFSNALADLAKEFSRHTDYISPFGINARRWNQPGETKGGKPDDITVIADILIERPDWTKNDIIAAKDAIKNDMAALNKELVGELGAFLGSKTD